MFDFNAGVESHMPFAAPDPASGFSPREFCCMKVGGYWKIHQFRNGAWERVNTGLPDEVSAHYSYDYHLELQQGCEGEEGTIWPDLPDEY